MVRDEHTIQRRNDLRSNNNSRMGWWWDTLRHPPFIPLQPTTIIILYLGGYLIFLLRALPIDRTNRHIDEIAKAIWISCLVRGCCKRCNEEVKKKKKMVHECRSHWRYTFEKRQQRHIGKWWCSDNDWVSNLLLYTNSLVPQPSFISVVIIFANCTSCIPTWCTNYSACDAGHI